MRTALLILLLLATGPALAMPASAADALHRGNLSLAWDAHDSGLCGEALEYLAEIPADSPLAPRATWLRAECWYDLGEYSRAAEVLVAPEAAGVEGRKDFLLDIFWDQVWHATGREEYGEALHVLAEAHRALPGDPDLAALLAATRYRQQVAAGLAGEGAVVGAVRFLPRGEEPRGIGWVRAHPWQGEGEWVPQTTAGEWMPSVATRARDQGRTLWVQLPVQALEDEVTRAAVDAGLVLRREAWGWSVGRAGEWLPLDREEWRFRGAVEGLGARGAARFALRQAVVALAEQATLVAWVEDYRGPLTLSRGPEGLHLRHPESGRGFTLDPQRWVGSFHDDPAGWRTFWRDLTTELGRPARPYRCFCGRPVVVREVLVGDAGELLVVGQEENVAVVVAALCPEHLRYVDSDLALEWGVSPTELAIRARSDARDNPWQLAFGRGEVEGIPYLFLEGEGVSALARTPELLLGALERADGYGVRGTAVRVYAATGSTLVVARTDAPEGMPRLAAARLLLEQARHGALVAGTRLEYRATLRLPGTPQGTFQLTPVE